MPVNFKLNKLFFFLFLLQMWIEGCIHDADRDNPLDPNSDNYHHYGLISGKVYTYYPPFRPIPKAEILVIPDHYWMETNENGEFSMQNLAPKEYSIHVSCSGYATDSVQLHLKPASNEYLEFHLNGLPQIINYQIKSGHINRWWPQYDLYIIKADVEISDLDGLADISQVRLTMPNVNFSDSLNRTDNPIFFSALFYEHQFSVNSLYQILGYPFFLQIKDIPGAICESAPIYIVRIIEEMPIPISPQGLESVPSVPYLEWQELKLSYQFTYKIDIFRVDHGINTLVWYREGVDADSTSIQVTDSLTIGTYFWTIAIVDEFGNWSRSKEAAFLVE